MRRNKSWGLSCKLRINKRKLTDKNVVHQESRFEISFSNLNIFTSLSSHGKLQNFDKISQMFWNERTPLNGSEWKCFLTILPSVTSGLTIYSTSFKTSSPFFFFVEILNWRRFILNLLTCRFVSKYFLAISIISAFQGDEWKSDD